MTAIGAATDTGARDDGDARLRESGQGRVGRFVGPAIRPTGDIAHARDVGAGAEMVTHAADDQQAHRVIGQV